jgi:hypothetical protein
MVDDLEDKMKGRTLFYNIGNRAYGLCGIFLFSLPILTADDLLTRAICGLATSYFSADILTGHHHYLVSEIAERVNEKRNKSVVRS